MLVVKVPWDADVALTTVHRLYNVARPVGCDTDDSCMYNVARPVGCDTDDSCMYNVARPVGCDTDDSCTYSCIGSCANVRSRMLNAVDRSGARPA